MSFELPPDLAGYSDRSPPPKNRQLLCLAGFFIGLLAAIFLSVGVMVDVLVAITPVSVEQQLGRLIGPIYQQQAQPSEVQDQLNHLLDRLETHLPDSSQRDYQVLYVPQPTVNAIAIPGDRVILYQGLLSQAESENELMMILGHELGHFSNRDHLRQLGRNLLLRLVWTGLIGDPGSLQAIAISGAETLNNAQYSQRQEHQADEFGLDLLNKTYGHVTGAIDFFERASLNPNPNVAFLSTHPGSLERVQRLKQLATQRGYSEGERSPLPQEFQHQN